MAIVHSYQRYSDPSQGEGTSLDRQTSSATAFAKKHGHTLSDVEWADKGKSGYRGNKQKALNAFLREVAIGERIHRGDILFIEAIDRIGRKGIRETQDTVNTILKAGVSIAIKTPVEKMYRADDDGNNLGDAVELATLAWAANNYSRQLSDRVKGFYNHARKSAVENKTPLSPAIPSWLRLVGGEKVKDRHFEPIPEKVATIRFIYKRVAEGMGARRLLAELQEKGLEALGRSGKWNETFIRGLVRSRTTLGEYQPHSQNGNKREKIGEVIEGYYPAVIDEELWTRANAGLDNRYIERKEPSVFVNLLQGLCWDVIDGCPYNLYTFQQKRVDGRRVIQRRLKSYKAIQKQAGANTATVDLKALTDAIVNYLPEIRLVQSNANGSILETLEAKLAVTRKRIQEVEQVIESGDENVGLLLGSLAKLKATEIDLSQQVRQAIGKKTNGKEWASLLEAIAAKRETEEGRIELREAIKRCVEKVNLLTVKLGEQRKSTIATLAEIVFHGGNRRWLVLANGKTIKTGDSQDIRPYGITQLGSKTHILTLDTLTTKETKAMRKWLIKMASDLDK